MTIGLIAGTGFDDIMLEGAEVISVDTDYGSIALLSGTWHVPIVFVPRHGVRHQIPPHQINFRGIISALREFGCRDVFAVNVVGGIEADLGPGTLVCVNDFLDFTKGREHTFGNGPDDGGVVHADMTHAYHPRLRAELLASAGSIGMSMVDGGVYACFEGPRYESPAEIRMAKLLGGTVAGMTGVPEVTLAAEAGLRYAALSLVVNPAAGVVPEPISSIEIEAVLETSRMDVLAVLNQLLAARVGS